MKNCRSVCADDYDNDGIAELFVLTRYKEEPYLLYDLENETLQRQFLSDIPAQVTEHLER